MRRQYIFLGDAVANSSRIQLNFGNTDDVFLFIFYLYYFAGGKLLQTKLSPTVYDKAFQTRLMNNDVALYLLKRLQQAR